MKKNSRGKSPIAPHTTLEEGKEIIIVIGIKGSYFVKRTWSSAGKEHESTSRNKKKNVSRTQRVDEGTKTRANGYQGEEGAQ